MNEAKCSDGMKGSIIVKMTDETKEQGDNTVQYYTNDEYTTKAGTAQPFKKGECSEITTPGGTNTWRKYTCSGKKGAVFENNKNACESGQANDDQFDGTGAVTFSSLGPTEYYFVKCATSSSAASGLRRATTEIKVLISTLPPNIVFSLVAAYFLQHTLVSMTRCFL